MFETYIPVRFVGSRKSWEVRFVSEYETFKQTIYNPNDMHPAVHFFRDGDDLPGGRKVYDRFASFIIDRKDGMLKALAFPPRLLDRMREIAFEVGEVEAEESYWKISKTGSGYQTRYEVEIMEYAPLTSAQQFMVDKTIEERSVLEVIIDKAQIQIVSVRSSGKRSKPGDKVNRFQMLDLEDES